MKRKSMIRSRFIRPAAEAQTRLLPLPTALERAPIETILRAVDFGMPVYEMGATLMIPATISLWRDIVKAEVAR